MADEGIGAGVEGHTDVHGRIAGAAYMLHLVAAVADADSAVAGRTHDFAGALVVEHGQALVGQQHLLVDESAAQSGLTHEERRDEVLLHVDVLVVELGQQFLVDVAAQAHHGEFEEAGHGRRQHIRGNAVRSRHVEQDGAAGQFVEDLLRLTLLHLPHLGRVACREGADGQQRHQPGLLLAKEQLQDGVQRIRRRRALRQAVEPIDQRFVP